MKSVLENKSASLKFPLVATKLLFVIKRYFQAEGKYVINLHAVYYVCFIAMF